MLTFSRPVTYAAAVAILVGSLAFAVPSFAADDSAPSTTPTSSATPDSSSSMKMTPKGHKSMEEEVETRITTLHDKLMITADQEDAWGKVATAMRDNEVNIKKLIDERHADKDSKTAVEDMKSYQAIAQAHADGLGNVISAFEPLYESFSDDQKKNADMVFSTFEGHGPHDKMHHWKKKSTPSTTAPATK